MNPVNHSSLLIVHRSTLIRISPKSVLRTAANTPSVDPPSYPSTRLPSCRSKAYRAPNSYVTALCHWERAGKASISRVLIDQALVRRSGSISDPSGEPRVELGVDRS
jgi:hypothetical protein